MFTMDTNFIQCFFYIFSFVSYNTSFMLLMIKNIYTAEYFLISSIQTYLHYIYPSTIPPSSYYHGYIRWQRTYVHTYVYT